MFITSIGYQIERRVKRLVAPVPANRSLAWQAGGSVLQFLWATELQLERDRRLGQFSANAQDEARDRSDDE